MMIDLSTLIAAMLCSAICWRVATFRRQGARYRPGMSVCAYLLAVGTGGYSLTVALAPFNIEPLHPDRFILNQLDLAPLRALPALKRMRGRKRNPTLTPEAFADAFERCGLPAVASRLREASELI